MKRLIVIVSAVALLATVFSSCGGSATLRSEKDSLAYAVGIDLGNHIKRLDSTMNVDVVAAAMKDVLAGKEKMNMDGAYQFLAEYFDVRLPARNKAAGVEFLAQVERENQNVHKTESGLLYEIIEPGDPNVKATSDDDVVRVVYEGKLRTGVVFDSSIQRGDTIEFPLNGVIRGWTEGMKLVGKGGKIKLWIPSELGYGAQARPNIGANEPLVFDVTLVDVKPAAVPVE